MYGVRRAMVVNYIWTSGDVQTRGEGEGRNESEMFSSETLDIFLEACAVAH